MAAEFVQAGVTKVAVAALVKYSGDKPLSAVVAQVLGSISGH